VGAAEGWPTCRLGLGALKQVERSEASGAWCRVYVVKLPRALVDRLRERLEAWGVTLEELVIDKLSEEIDPEARAESYWEMAGVRRRWQSRPWPTRGRGGGWPAIGSYGSTWTSWWRRQATKSWETYGGPRQQCT